MPKNRDLPVRPGLRKSGQVILFFIPEDTTDIHHAYVFTGIKAQVPGKRRPSNLGKVVFPGGGRNATDKNLPAAALRELHEETGLEGCILKGKPVVYRRLSNRGTHLVRCRQAFYLGQMTGGSIKTAMPDMEMRELGWRPVHELLNPATPVAPIHLKALKAFLRRPKLLKKLREARQP